MYGKLFESMYSGTLVEDWRALVTFQQMIILCDADGMLDMTVEAISYRTRIPMDILEAGIKILESPDPKSRTPDQEGRRVERIDAHREWGWHLINHEKYKILQDADTVRHQTRERVRKHRENKKGVTPQPLQDVTSVTVTAGNGSKRHIDKDTDITKTLCRAVLDYLNKKADKSYQPVESNLTLIKARLKEYDKKTVKAVIDSKCEEWLNTDKDMYLRPKTLFGAENFAQYSGQLGTSKKNDYTKGAI